MFFCQSQYRYRWSRLITIYTTNYGALCVSNKSTPRSPGWRIWPLRRQLLQRSPNLLRRLFGPFCWSLKVMNDTTGSRRHTINTRLTHFLKPPDTNASGNTSCHTKLRRHPIPRSWRCQNNPNQESPITEKPPRSKAHFNTRKENI